LRIEKRMMFLILMLIVAVAAFNIVSTMIMVVTDKTTEIAILRTLGSSPLSVMGIFMVQGTVIGLVGTLIGMAGGISLALNVETIVPFIERVFHIQFLPADVYYISEFPSDLRWSDVTVISVFSFSISLLATIYPAWRASRTQPAEALRYE
jgi:lipoprotein-releasing system permease protein